MSIDNRFQPQRIKSKDGINLIRKYVYLPEDFWLDLDEAATATGTSLSFLIEQALITRISAEKNKNDSNSPCNN